MNVLFFMLINFYGLMFGVYGVCGIGSLFKCEKLLLKFYLFVCCYGFLDSLYHIFLLFRY